MRERGSHREGVGEKEGGETAANMQYIREELIN